MTDLIAEQLKKQAFGNQSNGQKDSSLCEANDLPEENNQVIANRRKSELKGKSQQKVRQEGIYIVQTGTVLVNGLLKEAVRTSNQSHEMDPLQLTAESNHPSSKVYLAKIKHLSRQPTAEGSKRPTLSSRQLNTASTNQNKIRVINSKQDNILIPSLPASVILKEASQVFRQSLETAEKKRSLYLRQSAENKLLSSQVQLPTTKKRRPRCPKSSFSYHYDGSFLSQHKGIKECPYFLPEQLKSNTKDNYDRKFNQVQTERLNVTGRRTRRYPGFFAEEREATSPRKKELAKSLNEALEKFPSTEIVKDRILVYKSQHRNTSEGFYAASKNFGSRVIDSILLDPERLENTHDKIYISHTGHKAYLDLAGKATYRESD